MGEESDKEVFSEYGNRILPASHPIASRVARVASRIITSAGLGHVKNIAPAGRADEWNMDADESWGSTAAIHRLRQEWEVYVINDDKTPNAFVTPGE